MKTPIDPVIAEDENLTIDRCLRNDPKAVSDEDLDTLIQKLRRDRAVFILAGEKKPRKASLEDSTDDAA